MAPGISMKAPLITLVVLTELYFALGNLYPSTTQVSALETVPSSSRLPITLNVISNIGKPGVLLYNLETENMINLRYSVNCSFNDEVYRVVATTSAKRIAYLTHLASFDISCADAVQKNGNRELLVAEQTSDIQNDGSQADLPSIIGVIEGEINMTVKANAIGRAFLTLVAQRVSEVNSKITFDHAEGEKWTYFSTVEGISYYETQNSALKHNNSISLGKVSVVTRQDQDSNSQKLAPNVVGKALIIVMQMPRIFDVIFRYVMYAVVILATVGMGVKVDFVVIKNVLKRPTAPIIGLGCQYVCMPLIAYVIAKVIPQESSAISLGIFTCGIVPGGGPSNMFSYLLGGDLSLSVTMTTLSSIAALGLLPLWLFTLGNTFRDETVEMHVPYEKILEALALIILPLFIGMIIKYKVSRVAKIISKILKPVLIIIVCFIIGFGIYTNFYIFKMINPMSIFAGCLLPYVGYLVGGIIAFLCCQTWTHIKTIAIETGIQNTKIAFLILFLSLQPPDNQLASIAPASSALMTPLPLFVAVVLYSIRKRVLKNRKLKDMCTIEVVVEKGDICNGKPPVVADISKKKAEKPLIILLWRRLTGNRRIKNMVASGTETTKELDIMLSEQKG